MKVNMFILLDALSNSVVESKLKRDYSLSLSRSRRFFDYPTDDDVGRGVYIVSEAELRVLFENPNCGILSIIYSGSSPISTLPIPERVDVIHISESLSPAESYSIVMDTFETLSNWHDELLLAIATNPNIKEILEIAVQPLDNPIVLVDAMGTCIEWAGCFPSDNLDFIWKTIFEKGRAFGPENGPIFKTDMKESGEQFTLLKGISPQYPREGIIVDVFGAPGSPYAKHIIGSIGSTTVHGIPYSGKEITLLLEIADCLGGFHNQLYKHFAKRERNISYLAKRILSGETVSPFRVNSLLKESFVNPNFFHIIVVDLTNVTIGGKQESIQRNLYNTYLGLTQRAIDSNQTALLFSGNIVILNQNAADIIGTAEATLNKMKLLFAPVSIKMGVSNQFANFFDLGRAFDQATCVLRIGNQMNPKEEIYDYQSYFIECLLENSGAAEAPELLCNEAAIRLSEHDSAQGTEYLIMAESYCKHNGNKARIAEEIFMHRNTLNYRLEKLSAIIDLSTMDEEDRLSFLFSCRVLRWARVKAAERK